MLRGFEVGRVELVLIEGDNYCSYITRLRLRGYLLIDYQLIIPESRMYPGIA